jgi:hypothetical protein
MYHRWIRYERKKCFRDGLCVCFLLFLTLCFFYLFRISTDILDHCGIDCVDGTDRSVDRVHRGVGCLSMIVLMILIVVPAVFIAVLIVPTQLWC